MTFMVGNDIMGLGEKLSDLLEFVGRVRPPATSARSAENAFRFLLAQKEVGCGAKPHHSRDSALLGAAAP